MIKKLKNMEIVNIVSSLNRSDSFLRNPEMKMSIKTAWKLRTNLKRLNDINEVIRNAEKDIMEYYADDSRSTQTEDGRTVNSEFLTEFNAKMTDLYNQENDIDIDMVGIDDFSNMDISLVDLEAISFMIADNSEVIE